LSDVTVRLKVCEGCGGLFLQVTNERLCRGCTHGLAGFPVRRKRGWRRKGQTYGLVAVLPTVQAVAATAPSIPDAIEWRVAEPKAEPRRVWKCDVENLPFLRKYTEAMLRRYLQLSMEAGRSPTLLGRELFRGNVTHCKMRDFTDSIVFCADMEKLCLALKPQEREVISRIALQQYSQGETAGMLGLSLRQTVNRYAQALDKLTARLLETGLMQPLGYAADGERVAA
jgi:hypothetical protein